MMYTSSSLLAVLAASLVLPPAGAQAWTTFPDDQPTDSLFHLNEPYPWVYYSATYGQPGHSAYKGVWRQPNQWPGAGATVHIKHRVQLSNARYYEIGGPLDPGVIPFPGTIGGYLEVNSLNLEPGAFLESSLEILSFDGDSVWSGGYITSGLWRNDEGTVTGPGRLRNKGTVTVTAPTVVGRGGGIFHNTNRIIVDSIAGDPNASLGVHAGHAGTLNESGVQPDSSVAVIELRGPGTSLTNPPGGGGGYPILHNRGVLRKSFGGTSTVSMPVTNYTGTEGLNPAPSVPPNRTGTIQVDEGTLVFDTGGFGDTTWYGMKAEIAAGSLVILRGSHVFEAGTTTVTGSGVLRFEGTPGFSFYATPGVTSAVLNAPMGRLECAGAQLYRLVNEGGITVTAPSRMFQMTNKGHIRTLTNLDFEQCSNGTPAERDAVLEIAGGHSIYTGSFCHNYGLLQKTGSDTATLTYPTTHYGAGDNLNIEVVSGKLATDAEVTFQGGSNIRVANGAEINFNYRNWHDGGGTLNFTGSGKYYLNAGAFLSTNTPEVPRTFNSAPGVFDCRGGSLRGPFTNAGEITVSAPSQFDRSFIGDNPITNSGTIHCLATSAGDNGYYSITMAALVRLPCTATSVLAFDIAGRPGDHAHWARLLENGQSSIQYGGKLRINFGNFTPASGDRWLVIDNWSGVPNTGDFAGVEFTNVPPGFTPTFEKLDTGIRVGLNAAPAPVNYEGWKTAQGFPDAAGAGFNADPDGDGWTNGLECALGTNPQSLGSQPDMAILRKDSGGDIFFAAQFKRPAAALRPTDLQYIAERTDSLGNWTSAGLVVEVGPPDAQGQETVIARPSEPMDYKSRTFIRLRVQQNP